MKFDPKFLFKNAGKIIQDNSPTILTGVGVVGVLATSYFVGKGTFQASEAIVAEEKRESPILTPMTAKDKALLVWKLYLPAVGVGSLTIAAIIMSNRIHARRLAALAAGYALLSGDFDEYREKAAEMLGGKKSAELNAKRSKDKIDQSGKPHGILSGQQSWFCDGTTRRIFPSTMETIKHAQNNLQHKLNNQGDVSLNHFYEEVDLDTTQLGDMLGWKPNSKIELVFNPILTEEYGAVTEFEFAKSAIPKYWEAK